MEELKQIIAKLESMDDRIKRVDTAICGDDEMGVIGMKQHVKSLREDFDHHIESDRKEFGELKGIVSKTKYWLMGAAAIITLLFTLTKFVSELGK